MIWQQFQRDVCQTLSDKGFWAYETINKQSGQPVDIIAAKSNTCYIIECKATKDDRFPLSRVEDNQIMAIERNIERGNLECWFAFGFSRHPDDILFVKAKHILDMIYNGVSSVSYEKLCELREDIE